MTDYFALLDQPRLPWLEADAVKEAFHRKSLHTHPDARGQSDERGAAEADFTQLNEAYRVLQDPKRRLQHLLMLEGAPPVERSTAVPTDIEQLFPVVAAATQRAHSAAEKYAAATSPLARSLLKPQLLQVQKQVEETLGIVEKKHAEALGRLQDLTKVWEQGSETKVAELSELYLQFSYVSRWMTELQERQVQLSGL